MYRAERLDGKGKVEGGYFEKTPDIIITHAFYITDDESGRNPFTGSGHSFTKERC